MSKEKIKTGTIIRPSPLKGIIIFNLVTLFLCFGIYIGIDLLKFDPTNPALYIIIVIWLAILVVTTIYFTKFNYYIINADGFTQVKFNQKTNFYYRNILFIDEIWTRKHKKIYLLTNEGIEKFFALDKEQVLLDLLLTNCKNVISTEEVFFRFPQVKIGMTKEQKKELYGVLKEQRKQQKQEKKEFDEARKKSGF